MNESKGLLGVRIHRLKNSCGRTDSPGNNPFAKIRLGTGLLVPTFASRVKLQDWVRDGAYENLERWIEEATESKSW
jgi:hypothetical protein